MKPFYSILIVLIIIMLGLMIFSKPTIREGIARIKIKRPSLAPIKNIGNKIVDTSKNIGGDIVDTSKNIGGAIVDTATDALNQLQQLNMVTSFFERLSGSINKLFDSISSINQTLSNI